MKILIIKIYVCFLRFTYFFFKLLPTKNKVVLISRQSNTITLDFELIQNELIKNNVKVVVLCKKIEIKEKIIANSTSYFFHVFVQMYHLATSKCVVIDSYCIPVSVLKHKSSLFVLQIWHSIGNMKKFGFLILDQKEGRNSKISKAMHMHENYDCVLCAGEGYKEILASQFNCSEDIVKILPLPRVDRILDREYNESIKSKILFEYPELKAKKNILYCPTFRKNDKLQKEKIEELISSFNREKYNLIIKLHPLSKIKVSGNVFTCKDYNSIEMMNVTDFLITDYSCVLYEAGLLGIPLYFWNFDFDEYSFTRNYNLDYLNELPGTISQDINLIISDIESGEYDFVRMNKFISKYVDYKDGNCTKKIVNLIIKEGKIN